MIFSEIYHYHAQHEYDKSLLLSFKQSKLISICFQLIFHHEIKKGVRVSLAQIHQLLIPRERVADIHAI